MEITITITNPTVNVLTALAGAHALDNAKMMEALGKASTALDALLDEFARAKTQLEPVPNDAPVQDAPIITPQADPQDTPLRSWEDLLDLQEGMSVHWQGQKYAFDGVVEKVDDYILDAFRHDDGYPDEKILFIRRDDTGKLVSLTMNDLQVGRLTLA